MSTNITNTNNGTSNGASRPKSSGQKTGTGEGGKRLPFASIPLPDPEMLERLANEFFLVMPRDLGDGNGSDASHTAEEVESEEIPSVMFTEEMLPSHETSVVESVPIVPASRPSSQPGPLTETDLRSIAASLGDATALARGAPSTTPAQPVAGALPDFGGGKISPIATTPTLPSSNELFSFQATPFQAAPGGAGLSGAPGSSVETPTAAQLPDSSTPHFLEGEKGGTPAAPFALPPLGELFSFPRVPAMPNAPGIQPGMQTIPSAPAPQASPSAPPANGSAGAPTQVPAMDAKGITPTTPPATAPNSVAPVSVASVSDASVSDASAEAGFLSSSAPPDTKAIYPGATTLPSTSFPSTSFPSMSELFSFPGVPGVQSAPGVPVLPSSIPTSIPSSTPTGLPAKSEMPSAPGMAAPASPAPQFEFRPDVIPDLGTTKRPLDPRLIRRDFPILEERVHGRQLVWLDNAATTQKPNAVIDRLTHFYKHENSNIHRAAHELAARATDAYESAREKARRFLNASSTREVIFVRGTTEGINLVAQTWGRRNVQKDDEIVITWLEHHANIVPWQQLCSEKGARLRVAPVNDRGEIILEEYEKLLGPRTRIVSFSQVSNALGTITPAREMVEMAHRYGARVLVDGAQAVSHMRADVQALNCDFYVFSGHKVFGPTGIGVVYGKLDVLENMPPWQGGGNMIVDVTFEKTTYQSSPARFEAGTGNIADAVGLGAALDYVEEVGMENIAAYEHELLNYGTAKLMTVPGLRLIGTAREKAGVMSFVLDEIRTEDVGVALNEEGIAVRSGHHCAQPILRRMGVESTVRPSVAFYNTCEELDHLVATLLRIQAGRGRRQ
jgi:cysteine desulfurase / selenocysteine lyase